MKPVRPASTGRLGTGEKTGVARLEYGNQFCTSPLKQRKVHETRKTCLYWQTRHRREDRGQNGHSFTILISHLCS